MTAAHVRCAEGRSRRRFDAQVLGCWSDGGVAAAGRGVRRDAGRFRDHRVDVYEDHRDRSVVAARTEAREHQESSRR